MKVKRIICIFVMAIVIGSIMCSCGVAKNNGPTASVETYIQAFKDNNTEAMDGVYSGDVEDATTNNNQESELEKFLDERIRNFEYECSNEQINGDTATVDVSITTYDWGEAYKEAIDDYLSQIYAGSTDVDAEKLVVEKLSKLETLDYVKTVSVKLSKSDGIWMVDEFDVNDPFWDAIYGGIISASSKTEASLGQDSSSSSSGSSSYSNSYESNDDIFTESTDSYGYDPNDPYAVSNDADGDGKLTAEEYLNALDEALEDYVNTHDDEFSQDLHDYGY